MQQSLLKVILCGFFFQSLLKAGALLLIDMPLNLFLRKVTHPADNSIRKKEAQRTLLHIVLLVMFGSGENNHLGMRTKSWTK